MKLTRLIGTALWIAVGVAVSSSFGARWGKIGYAGGFLVGALGAFLLTWWGLLTLHVLLKPWPECRRKKCHTFRDYVWKRGSIYGREKGSQYRYRCKCGDEYLRRGRRFLKVSEDGSVHPFKIYQKGAWMDDT
jgi:hypothetical protein